MRLLRAGRRRGLPGTVARPWGATPPVRPAAAGTPPGSTATPDESTRLFPRPVVARGPSPRPPADRADPRGSSGPGGPAGAGAAARPGPIRPDAAGPP